MGKGIGLDIYLTNHVSAANKFRKNPEILCKLVPEFKECIGFKHSNPKNHDTKDVYEHLLLALESLPHPCELETKMAVLLHDIGKPQCAKKYKKKKRPLEKHALVSSKIAKKILKDMPLRESVKKDIIELIKYHDIPIEDNKKWVTKWCRKIGYKQMRRLMEVKYADAYAHHKEPSQKTMGKLEKMKRIQHMVIYGKNERILKRI